MADERHVVPSAAAADFCSVRKFRMATRREQLRLSFQILLTRPAVNDEDKDRVEFTLYYLKLAPWIARPAPPPARAGTMMAASRTKFKVALERSHLPESSWSVKLQISNNSAARSCGCWATRA